MQCISYNAAVSDCEKATQWELAVELLAQMPRAGLRCNAITCDVAVSASEKAAQWWLALRLLAQLPRSGLRG
eukprot:758673-Lingulodinium_polyedra.AAC.1